MNQKFLQTEYFSRYQNQFPAGLTIKPLYSQILEMDHLLRFLPKKQNSSFLDFGSGSGRLSIFLSSKGHRVYSYDISNSSLKSLNQAYISARKKGWGKISVITKIKNNMRVDFVTGTDVLHHVSIPKELKKIFSLTKSGGTVAFSEPNAFSPFWYIFHFFRHTPWDVEAGLLNCYPARLIKYFNQAGFIKVNISHHGIFPTRLFTRLPYLCRFNAYTLTKVPLLKNFSYRLIISARKPSPQKPRRNFH
jgi:SAM-dependent methyltransferase